MMKSENIKEIAIIIEPLLRGDDADAKIAEIKALVNATGVLLTETIAQRVVEINPAYFIGEGKLKEIKQIAEDCDANLIIFDGELTPSQQNNISNLLDLKVITRTTLILDIFAMRASSPEGKILVQLAQLKYIYPRLSGKGIQLSRLGAGIGTRGPGETKLETDRRRIKGLIRNLESKLTEIEARRETQHKRREKKGVKTIALVGYTNTGKSTLLKLLSNSEVLIKDQLFATLDPTARKTQILGYNVVIIDTVGFISNLPSELMEAFKSTLDCAVNADLILNVCDISADWEMQLSSTKKTLDKLGANAKQLFIANKCDKIDSFEDLPHEFIYISAKDNLGIDTLRSKIAEQLFGGLLRKSFMLAHEAKINYKNLGKLCESFTVNYVDDGIKLDIIIDKAKYPNFTRYLKQLENQP